MAGLKTVRNAAFAITLGVWAAVCYAFWQTLVRSAAGSPEIYTRSPGFQLFNFLVQYLWFFLLLLAAALAIEWLLFRVAAELISRPRHSA
jgi:hypothetical protein